MQKCSFDCFKLYFLHVKNLFLSNYFIVFNDIILYFKITFEFIIVSHFNVFRSIMCILQIREKISCIIQRK